MPKPTKKNELDNLTASAKDLAKKTGEKAGTLFGKMKDNFQPVKINKFQEKWLNVPKKRTKYTDLKDAPKVAAEEAKAMTSDLIDLVQGEKGGKSHLIRRLKTGISGFLKDPAKYVQSKNEAVSKPVEEKKVATKKPVSKVVKKNPEVKKVAPKKKATVKKVSKKTPKK